MRHRLPFHSNAVLPPPLLWTAFIVAYGLVTVGLWAIDHAVPLAGDVLAGSGQVKDIRMVILTGAAAFYAASRLWRFHPACNLGYSTWLRLSPWTAQKRLPLGPLHPVWQDGAVIGSLSAITYCHAHGDPLQPLTAFVLVYLGIFTVLLAYTRQWSASFVLGLLWPALMLTDEHRTFGLGILAAIILAIWHGHCRSLRAFPWPSSVRPAGTGTPFGQIEVKIDSFSTSSGAGKCGPISHAASANLGWPVRVLSPRIKPPSVSARANLAMATLIGWWCYCIVKSTRMDPLPELILLFACCAAAFRLAIYCSGFTPPFNILGRISSGRVIVPGFDKIFLAPLGVVAVAVVGGIIIKRSGPWYPVAEAVVAATVWLVLFGAGPTLSSWVLTGYGRLSPPRRGSANRLLREV
jgi:hypothetical protein